MNHLPVLIRDLGLILIIAGITTLLFKKLRQPLVLGYILAGFLVSPNIRLIPTITDASGIKIWADIGVIFLLFTLGLEFSFKKLLRIGGSAAITAFFEVTAMLGVGFVIGKLLGWSFIDCVFLGGILSISSTTIILRAFDELKLKNKPFAQLVFGVLVIEDLVAVVLLVLLSTIAVSRTFEGGAMMMSILKLSFFLLLWFFSGIFFIPTFLRKIERLLTDETMLILSIGLCLMMVLLASLAGFSPALGAFIMGSILAETTQAERIEILVRPVKDLFGAVFFVSVGMLIDPNILLDYSFPILLISTTFIVFKTLNVTSGALISGQPLKLAIYAGMSQAQIGEFSFIIATLGLTLGVTSNFLFPIAVAVSAITTFTTPYMMKASKPLYNWVEGRLPVSWRKTLSRYSSGTQNLAHTNDWQLVIKAFFIHVAIFSLIILGIIFLFSAYVKPWVNMHLHSREMGNLVAAIVCLIVLSPFLWALITRKIQTDAFTNLWANKRHRAPLIFFRVLRGVIAIVYIGILLFSFFPIKIATIGLIALVSFALLFTKSIHRYYLKIENSFFYNYNNRERVEAVKGRHELAPWDAHITQFILPMHTPLTGMNLEQIAVREKLGVNIVMIKRGEHFTISAPSRYERVYPGDILFVIGTNEQLEAFKKFIEPMDEIPEEMSQESEGVVLKKIRVIKDSFLEDKSIRESSIREKTNGLVVGVERNNKRILNPESNFVLKENDLLWVVGNQLLIENLEP